jgi:hypothetical protein
LLKGELIILNCSEGSEKTSPPVVTHLTRVSIRLTPDEDILMKQGADDKTVTPELVRQTGLHIADHHKRVAEMMEFLARHGFSFKVNKKAIYCYSSEVEAGVIKRLLLAEGFKDREFQIHLEYTRGWGML